MIDDTRDDSRVDGIARAGRSDKSVGNSLQASECRAARGSLHGYRCAKKWPVHRFLETTWPCRDSGAPIFQPATVSGRHAKRLHLVASQRCGRSLGHVDHTAFATAAARKRRVSTVSDVMSVSVDQGGEPQSVGWLNRAVRCRRDRVSTRHEINSPVSNVAPSAMAARRAGCALGVTPSSGRGRPTTRLVFGLAKRGRTASCRRGGGRGSLPPSNSS